jgi:hypothetical protein
MENASSGAIPSRSISGVNRVNDILCGKDRTIITVFLFGVSLPDAHSKAMSIY